MLRFYKDMNEFKGDCQRQTNVVKDDKCDLLLFLLSILNRWMNHFPQQLNIYGVNDFGQTETHTAEKLVPESWRQRLRLTFGKI
jgi:hypothetical protein